MEAFMIFLLLVSVNSLKSYQKISDKFVKPFPYLRLKMEEVFGDQIHESVDESSDNFVSFLVDNVKELFLPHDNSTMTAIDGRETLDSALLLNGFQTSTDTMTTKTKPLNNAMIMEHFFLPFLHMDKNVDDSDSTSFNEPDMMINLLESLNPSTKDSDTVHLIDFKRTCITCNNIVNDDCSNPKFKLVPSVDCQREDDLCYSQHTPFGIIDRGCFNVNHDLTLFVCACNLCNYISISEMPYMFSNKRDWVENVIELSRAKRFRDSILKDMSCLRCEVNVSAKRGNIFADSSCLEGNIASLPKQVCTADEICAVKAIRSQGYIWRGCVSEPLYNYWWRLCDSEWCNNDSVASIYDAVN